MPHGVIFDLDGVLVASGPAHQASWRALARKHGIQVTDAVFTETFGRPSRDIIRLIWGANLTDADVQRIDEEKEALYRSLITGMVPLTIGTREMLASLAQAGFVLAVATSAPAANLDLVLNETRIAPYFTATVHGFDVQRGKPAPDCFLLAARRAGLAPAECVVVEDAPVGVEAARAANMPAIGFTGTHPPQRLMDAGAAWVVERLSEITPKMVERLLSS